MPIGCGLNLAVLFFGGRADMAELTEAIEELRRLDEPVPLAIRLPSEVEVAEMERKLDVRFHPDFKTYLLAASDVTLGTIEPATITDPGSHTYLPSVVEGARKMGVPDTLLPFCEDNGDYFCLLASGEVVFWSHNGVADERWRSLAAWIRVVWIEEGR